MKSVSTQVPLNGQEAKILTPNVDGSPLTILGVVLSVTKNIASEQLLNGITLFPNVSTPYVFSAFVAVGPVASLEAGIIPLMDQSFSEGLELAANEGLNLKFDPFTAGYANVTVYYK